MLSTVTDLKFGSIAVNDPTVGTYAWIDPLNVTKNARSYTTLYVDQAGQQFVVRDVKLMIGGAIVGTNQASNNSLNAYTATSVALGGSTNLWGLSSIETRAARRGDFGVMVSTAVLSSTNVLVAQTNYISVYGFKFDIPIDAVITGVQVQVVGQRNYAGPGIDYGELYYIRMRVYYNWNGVMQGVAKSDGYIDINEQPDPDIPQNKSYQYMTYEKNQFRGEWIDVETMPSMKLEINKLPGELPVTLARNLDSKEVEFDEILLTGYGGAETLITTQNRETILAGDESSFGIGSGTDLEVDHTVNVKEFYGGYEPLLTHKQDVLLTSQGEPLVIANGYPRGRNYYKGYVSDFGLIYDADKQDTSVKLLHLSEELNNDIYRTPDTIKYNGYDTSQNLAYGFGGFEKSDGETVAVGFTFTAGSAYKLKRIVMALSGWRNNIITITLRSGGTMGAGTVLATATATITDAGINKMSFAFPDSVLLTNAAVYNVSVESQFFKQTMSQSYPAWLYVGTLYPDGTNYTLVNGVWGAANSSFDIGFELWQEGGDTRVNELSIDPSQIMRKVLDYNKTQGGLIRYDSSSITSSFTVVSAPFNTNTLKEAADYVLKLTPSNWFYYVDPGELLFNLHGQPELVTQWFTLKKDIIKLELHKNIEKIINDVLFTGGGDPALFRESVDIPSRAQWRKGLAKLSDNRVTDATTADILMDAAMDEVSQPIWLGTVEVLRSEHPKAIRPGELSGFRNFGNIIDLLTVQIVAVDVTPDTYVCQLGTQAPKQSQRIEDIKRNLTRIELENNPNAPS